MNFLQDIYTSYLIPSWNGVYSWIIESVNFGTAFLESLSFEQGGALFLCFVLLTVTRNLLFIKRTIKKTLDSEEKIENFIKEIKHSEDRINDSIKNLKKSHKSKFENIMEYIPPYPIQIDRTDEILNLVNLLGKKSEDSFNGLTKRNKDEIKLLELLRRELQEVREDNSANIEQELSNLPMVMEEIKSEQYKRFNRIDKQIDNIDVSPVVNIPQMPEIKIPAQKDYTEELDKYYEKYEQTYNKFIIAFENRSSSNENENNFKILKEKIAELLDYKTDLDQRLKQMEHKIIDAMPVPTILRESSESNQQEFNFPDFRKLNRDLLVQIEEAVSARLEELNKSIIESRELSSNEIENTIASIDKIATLVTSKLSSFHPDVIDNGVNNIVLSGINDLSNELENLKTQVSNILKQEIIIPQQSKLNIEEIIDPKLKEIERIFNEGKEEIKTEIKTSGNNISDLILNLPIVNRDDLSTMDINLSKLYSGMNNIINRISDIDITMKENQDKFNMIFFTHINDLKNSINEFREETNDVNLEPIISNIETRFNKLDHNFDKFLKQLSNIDSDGSKYEIELDKKSIDEIKHIFEVDIINQYQEQMIFLELLGNKISELSFKNNK